MYPYLSELIAQTNASACLEALMLICFGLAWPLGNLRMLRTRRPLGPGIMVTSLILCGYLAGALAKLAATGDAPYSLLLWFYLANAASVAVNLILQAVYGNRCAVVPETARSEAGRTAQGQVAT